MSTIFKKIIDKEIPAEIIYEDDFVIAFNDINPKAPIHILIIPKKEIPTLNDISEEDEFLISKLLFTAKKIAKDMGFDKNGYRIVMNCNADGGQEVYHLHFHLLAGKKLSWNPA